MTEFNKRISALTEHKRVLLAKLVSKEAEMRGHAATAAEATGRPPEHALQPQYDIVVTGGGLAGLTVAMQMQRAIPRATILVVNSGKYPVPEAAHKVGESSVEIGAHYYDTVLGFKEHLEDRQLRKMGLRFFSPYGDNTDLAKRVELGPFENHILPIPSYQIDRGRFENALAVRAGREGIGIVDETRVTAVNLGHDGAAHTLQLKRGEEVKEVTARWVVDASGRAALLRRKLGLTKPSEHNVNAAWLRIKLPIDLEKFSDDAAFRKRMLTGFRQYSTNHLMGRGYWVWLIRLASGSTSVGIVADPRIHPLAGFNQVDRFLDWLDANEPQTGDLVRRNRHLIQDFLAIKGLAHTTEQVYSKDRWAMVGDAALFTDPLYSLGSDFIGMGNTMVTDMVRHDMAGGDLAERVELYSWLYLDFLYDSGIRIFQDQYPLMGNAQVFVPKALWDIVWYWASIGPVFFHNKFTDLEFLHSIKQELIHFQVLQRKMQDFFRAWDERTKDEVYSDAYVDLTQIPFIYPLVHLEMDAGYDDDALRAKLSENVSLLEAVGAEMYRQAYGSLPDAPMTDSGLTLEQHMRRAAMRGDVREELSRAFFATKAETAMAGSPAV
ncbi:MAG: NAD(P)/FAD-dependent oxidoreductase [Acidobacteriaceae bacterium]